MKQPAPQQPTSLFSVVPAQSKSYGYSLRAPAGFPGLSNPVFGWYRLRRDAEAVAAELNEARQRSKDLVDTYLPEAIERERAAAVPVVLI